MSNVWTATNIIVTKTEVAVTNPAVPPGNKAVDFAFTSNILADGVLHHNYNEPHWSPLAGKTATETATQIIQNHLAYWTNAGGEAASFSIPDVAVPVPTQKTQYQIDLEAFQLAQSVYIKMYNANASAIAAKETPPYTDKELADAYTAWKVAVSAQPEFWAMVPKDFPYPA